MQSPDNKFAPYRERLARLHGPADAEPIDACAGRYSDQVVRNPMVLGRATYSP